MPKAKSVEDITASEWLEAGAQGAHEFWIDVICQVAGEEARADPVKALYSLAPEPRRNTLLSELERLREKSHKTVTL